MAATDALLGKQGGEGGAALLAPVVRLDVCSLVIVSLSRSPKYPRHAHTGTPVPRFQAMGAVPSRWRWASGLQQSRPARLFRGMCEYSECVCVCFGIYDPRWIVRCLECGMAPDWRLASTLSNRFRNAYHLSKTRLPQINLPCVGGADHANRSGKSQQLRMNRRDERSQKGKNVWAPISCRRRAPQ